MAIKELFILVTVIGSAVIAVDLQQSAYLDVEERYHIEWEFTDDNITITAKVKTTGWFGLGFSPNGGMAGADIVTMGVVGGKPFVQDRHAERNGYPMMDASQDVELISGSEEDGVTTIKFSRKHNTCDDNDMPIGTDTMRVIYAISPDGSDSLSYHVTNRGTRSLYLRADLKMSVPIPDDAFTMDVTVEDIDIPAFHTRYYCELKRAPKFATKHHLIKVEPLIQPENLGLVHHILIYGCFDNKNREKYFVNGTTGHDCYNGNMPDDINDCRTPVTVWAIGGGAMNYPAEAGYPVGTDKSPDYYMMEVHYDNPNLLSGRKDSSGMRLTFTPTLRKYDSGIMPAGSIYGIAIPPGAKDFQTTAFCSSRCTGALMKEKVNIFGAFLHGHLAARQVIARQFRNGTEIGVIDMDRRYDFNYQQYRKFKTPLEMLPGDDVMVTCHYNTEDRTTMTYGDLPSTSEMCITYLQHYPVQEVGECFTIPAWARYLPAVAEKLENVDVKPWDYFVPVFDKMAKEGKWTENNIKALQDAHLSLPQGETCNNNAHQYIFGFGREEYQQPADSRIPLPEVDYSKDCPAKTDEVVGK